MRNRASYMAQLRDITYDALRARKAGKWQEANEYLKSQQKLLAWVRNTYGYEKES